MLNMNNNVLDTVDIMGTDGKIWTIKKENLDNAKQLGAVLVEKDRKVNVTNSYGKPWKIDRNHLPAVLQGGGSFVSWDEAEEQNNQHAQNQHQQTPLESDQGLSQHNATNTTTSQQNYSKPEMNDNTSVDSGNSLNRAKEFGQGAASNFGSVVDFVNNNTVAPLVKKVTGMDARSSFEEKFPKADFLKTTNEPDGTTEVLRASGDVAASLAPFSVAMKGVRLLTTVGGLATKVPWVAKMNNFLATPVTAKNAAIFAASGAGGELAKSNNPNTSELENISREIAGSIFAGITVESGLTRVGAGMSKILLHPEKYISGKTKQEMTLAQIVESSKKNLKEWHSNYKQDRFVQTYSGKVDEKTVATARKYDLPLTTAMVTDNPKSRLLSDNTLRSNLVDETFNEFKKNMPSKTLKAIEEQILDSVGKKIDGTTTKSAASQASNIGISSLQLSKEIGVTQKTAWFMLQRLREACGNDKDLGLLAGIVEADETYIGGKEANKYERKKLKAGRGAVCKVAVLGMRERGGDVKATVLLDTKADTIQSELANTICASSILCTDEHRSCLGVPYAHFVVNHSAKRFVDEVTYRLNEGNCKVHTIDRIDALIRKTNGVRGLTYANLIGATS